MLVIPYWHVDAFAAHAFEGNQAAVMIYEHGFPDDTTMARIGNENNFAETAFLVPHEGPEADWHLRWFTPDCEIRLCGHATLAAGHVVLSRDGGDVVRFQTRQAGVLTVKRTDDCYALGLPAIPTRYGEFPQAVAALGDAPAAIARSDDGYNLFFFENAAKVRALQPDMKALATLGDHQFICTAPGEDTDIVSRVFVPGAGVDEDSVTGSAHAALTPFWADRLARSAFTAFQASHRGGHLSCRLDGDVVWLGGPCVTVVEGFFSY
ncbi:PhzF family phenazine biosynthesis protein [Croceicoccus naphthovorans]|uniref:PhzF family phenazine biosynthesis protein n=1 Tax=Croceicoccus naphthovorans TaxID=1348774 RepID=A0A0G3XKP0_9SPHN|nr:PhzF family phenazine biosynthesis protein [Croceicoccus naphthovorans]AKM11166.1 PhzF family phenazine biosynthesis protein [Croceicoccus naphthovorans]MBB3989948.1 putative PhzF superfamily epimerase YddE/YHI9 [Croceicoccus naphthovorans]